jgi:hypothetical protein
MLLGRPVDNLITNALSIWIVCTGKLNSTFVISESILERVILPINFTQANVHLPFELVLVLSIANCAIGIKGDFLPWRFSDAGRQSVSIKPQIAGAENLHNNCLTRCNMSGPYGKDRLAVSPKSDEAFL